MTKNDITSIIIVGVGGQGILRASEIIAQAALYAGYRVKTHEIHGMAQRGGSVMGQIRYGKEVYSPLIEKGTARILASLERMEALRYVDYAASDALVVVNSQMIVPVTVSMGIAHYPADTEQRLRGIFPRLIYCDAAQQAQKLGNIRVVNTIIIGALSTGLDLPVEAWHAALTATLPAAALDINIKAFNTGRTYTVPVITPLNNA